MIKLISGAVRENRNFEPPDRKVFQECVMNALRAAKQKHRRAIDANDNEVTTRRRMQQIADELYTKPSNNNVKKTGTSSELKLGENNTNTLLAKYKHRRETDVKDDEVKKRRRLEQIADVSYAKSSNKNVNQAGTSSGSKSSENNTDMSFSEDSVSSEDDHSEILENESVL